MTKHIFIIGSKGIPANYGGFETFVDKLAENRIDTRIQYHVACMGEAKKEFKYHDARCFTLKVPDIGPARAVYYDIQAIKECIRYARENHLQEAEIYILACRIGPFIGHFKRKMKKLNMQLYVNPDGHEWLRGKWNAAIRRYWKFSERLMVKHADRLICDSKNIADYIQQEYEKYKPETTFIAYGAETEAEILQAEDSRVTDWYRQNGVSPGEYYLVVGRFVPENNYETMMREFISSNTMKSLVLVTNVEQNKFYEKLITKTGFNRDARIKFVGTVYDSKLLNRIRKDAFAYLHGHEVGGTNPSLLEALSITNVNLLLNIGFNCEVAEQGALYWSKETGNLRILLEQTDQMTEKAKNELGQQAKKRIKDYYNWIQIVKDYETLFLTKN